MAGKFVLLTPGNGGVVAGVDADSDLLIEAANDSQVADISGLTNVTVFLEQVADAGTVVLVTEGSPDGTAWYVIDASTAESDFPAGANAAVSLPLNSAQGMPLRLKQVRIRASALAGGGTYRMLVTGQLAENYA